MSLAGMHLTAATLYVSLESPNPSPPYADWATAARVIQDAVDAAQPGDEILVANGVYATGGRVVYGTMANRVAVPKPLTLRSVDGPQFTVTGTNVLVNRVAVDKPVALQSVSGPQFTIIQGHQVPVTTNGGGAIRCVYLGSSASLSGFTLTKGATRSARDDNDRDACGGGVWCESVSAVLTNCALTGSTASDSGGGV